MNFSRPETPLHRLPRRPRDADDRRRLFRRIASLNAKQTSHPTSKRGRGKAVKRLLLAAEIAAFILVMLVIVMAISLRHAMHAALPQIDGNLTLAGLTSRVTVTRDTHGVPTLRASNLDDLLFAQGYVTAQDRLFQMDLLRRHGSGELAEILGPSLVQHDRMQRYLQIRAAADRGVAALPDDQLHQLECYAHGVNAYIATHRDTLPVEFHILHYTPAPWSPRDSMLITLVMSQDLSTSFPQKLDREALEQHLPPALLADLYPVGSWRDRPPTQVPLDLTAPTDEIKQIPLDRTQTLNDPPQLASPHDLMSISAALAAARCVSCRAGSNNWAVSGAHSASGAPLLSNDMHLGLTAPDIWYEAALHAAMTPDNGPLDVTGFTLPGVPFVISGRNAHVAWGFTNTGSDVQDVRVEHVRGSGADTEYERPDGTWALATHHAEHIHVRAGRDVNVDVLTTTMTMGQTTLTTPIISPLYPTEQRTLSLAWNIYDPSILHMPLLAIDTAPDAASLVAAFAGFGSPSENLVYADRQHIGFHELGRVPIRGPAMQRPHAVQPLVLPGPSPERDEDEEDPGPVATSSATSVHLAKAGWKQATWQQGQIAPQPTSPYTIGSPLSDVPVDALDVTQVWSGYIPYDALPSVLDPVDGVVATANARVTPENYPYSITNNWADAYRVERIETLLEHRTGLKPADMLAVQTDVHSEFDLVMAQRLAYAIDHASPAMKRRDPRLVQAADILRDWKGNVSVDSPAAAIVNATHTRLWPLLLMPQIERFDEQRTRRKISADRARSLSSLYVWGERTTALEALLEHNPRRWLPQGYASWNDLLAEAVADALRVNHAPSDLRRWRYGDTHPVEIAHPVFGSESLVSRLLGVATGTGMQPTLPMPKPRVRT
jgi:penicillin amidase